MTVHEPSVYVEILRVKAARIAELEAALRTVDMWFTANAGSLDPHEIPSKVVKQALVDAEGEA